MSKSQENTKEQEVPAVQGDGPSYNEMQLARRSKQELEVDESMDDLDDLLVQSPSEDDNDTDLDAKGNLLAAAVITKLKKATSVSRCATSFPVSDLDHLVVPEKPLERMELLLDELAEHGNYHFVRTELCQLSISLNIEGKKAPAFRPKVVTGKKYGDAIFEEIHRDQVVIDCHWLHSTKQRMPIRSKDVEYKALFQHSKPFPFDLAWTFACEKWKLDHRVIDMLRLTQYQQCQLSALRSKSVKKRIDGVEHGSRKENVFTPAPLSVFEQGLSAWCDSGRSGDSGANWCPLCAHDGRGSKGRKNDPRQAEKNRPGDLGG